MLLVANLLVGNAIGTEGFEITLLGPRISFLGAAIIAVYGATVSAKINGAEVPMWCSVLVKSGSELSIGEVTEGARAYLAVRGGLPDM